MCKQSGLFNHRNYIEKSTWKQRRFFYHQNYIEKSTWKRRGFFNQRNYIEEVRGNDVKICQNLIFDVSTQHPRRIDVTIYRTSYELLFTYE